MKLFSRHKQNIKFPEILPPRNLEPQKLDHDWIYHFLYLGRLQYQCPRREKKLHISQETHLFLCPSHIKVHVPILCHS